MPFARILLPLDGSRLAEEALPHALRLAEAFKAQLLLLQVLDIQPSLLEHCPGSPDWRLRRLQAQRYLEAVAERCRSSDVAVESHLGEGRAAEEIVAFVRDRQIDLIVLSAYGWGGVTEFPFGGTVQKVLATAGVSYAVIRPGPAGRLPSPAPAPYQRILVPLDGSRRAEWAFSLVSGIAKATAAEIILLQIVQPPDMPRRQPLTRDETELSAKIVECNRREAAAYLAEVRSHLGDGQRIQTRLVVSAQVADTIAQVAEHTQADLIAMTAHGASDPGTGSVGPVAHAVLSHSLRPVLVFQDGSRPLAFEQVSARMPDVGRTHYASPR